MYPSSWEVLLSKAYASLSDEYRHFLEEDNGYFPSKSSYLNAFNTLPKQKVKYILFGQDPYPREESAGGYAFIDMKVKRIFSDSGLSKEVNKATSLRNFIKMLLLQRANLNSNDVSQEAISHVDKTALISTVDALRVNFEKNGVLLLNTALIFTDKKSSLKHVKAWRPFMQTLLEGLEQQNPTLILFGTHAKALEKQFNLEKFEAITIEHPYNQSFITNPNAHKVFGSMNLLER